MNLYFIGPGGSGKTTIAKQLATQLNADCVDLDEYFLKTVGHIGEFIEQQGYQAYARRNVEAYLDLKYLLSVEEMHIVVCSSGFMLYDDNICPEYREIKQELLNSPNTYLFLASMDMEKCIQITVQRQMARTYLKANVEHERAKISNRFSLYAAMPCKTEITDRALEVIVSELMQRIQSSTH